MMSRKSYKLFLLSLLIFSHLGLAATGPENDLQVKFRKKSVNLLGRFPELNEPAPIFELIDENFNAIDLTDFKGQTVFIISVPSIDIGTYQAEAIRLDEQVANFPDNVVMLAVSTDLPFTQKRFSQQQNIQHLMLLSDSAWREFGTRYGLLMKDKGLLASELLIIDKNGYLRYRQLIKNSGNQPDFADALAALRVINSQEY